GLSIVSLNSERFFEAELYRLKARALLLRGAPNAGEEAPLDQALRTAHAQQARSLGLPAATDLPSLLKKQGNSEQALAGRSSIYGRFTEGFETRDLKEARDMLVQLQQVAL